MAHSTGSSGAGSGSMCFANNSPVACSSLAFSTASRKPSSPSARKRRQPVVHTWGFVAEVRDCASCPFGRRLAPPCLAQCQAVEGAIKDRAGKSGARLRLDAALEAAEDGHVAGLQVRRASWREDLRARREGKRFAWLSVWPRWRGRWPCPRIHDCPSLLGFSTSSRVAASCRIVVVVAQLLSEVT